jgi:hypothetical protein
MAKLMGEDADAAVLRLHHVVADPVVAAADLDTASEVAGRPDRAGQVVEGEPAMAPDGVVALRATAGLLTLTSVD